MYLVQKGHAELFETEAGEHRGQAGTAALCYITTVLLWTLDIHWLGRRIAVVATTAWRHATVRLLRWRWVVSTLRRVPATRRTAHGVSATLTRWGTCRRLVRSPSGTARSSVVIIFRRHGGRTWGNERGAEPQRAWLSRVRALPSRDTLVAWRPAPPLGALDVPWPPFERGMWRLTSRTRMHPALLPRRPIPRPSQY